MQMLRGFPILAGALILLASCDQVGFATQNTQQNDGVITAAEWQAIVSRGRTGGVVDLGTQRVEFTRGPITAPANAPLIIRGGRFGAVTLDGWTNVSFVGSTFTAGTNHQQSAPLILAYNVRNLTIDRARFTAAPGYAGAGRLGSISLRGGDGITIRNSTFQNIGNFLSLLRSTNVVIERNDFIGLNEGVVVVGADRVRISGNRFGPYVASDSNHRDGVQLFTTGLTQAGDRAASNVVIENNLIYSDSTSRSQGVFIRDEAGLYRQGRGYRNITVRNNLLVGTGWHGIAAVDPVQNMLVENNRLYTLLGPGDRVTNNWIMVGGPSWTTPAIVRGNIHGRSNIQPGTVATNNRSLPPITAGDAQALILQWQQGNRAQAGRGANSL
jgi:hypothetical protein